MLVGGVDKWMGCKSKNRKGKAMIEDVGVSTHTSWEKSDCASLSN